MSGFALRTIATLISVALIWFVFVVLLVAISVILMVSPAAWLGSEA